MGVFISVFLAAAGGAARAQTASPTQIQAQIAGGDVSGAINQLQTAVQLHPKSGVAWYLMAEAQDAAGHTTSARAALATAEQLAPGLPFANQQDVAALQAHLAVHGGGGMPPVWLVIGGLVVLFLLVRLFFRSRRPAPMAYGAAYNSPPLYPNGTGAGFAPGGGGGVGSALLSGLVAGAGFAAGERIIDDMTRPDQFPEQDQSFNQDSSRDDGLQGDPGWDDSSGGDFDPGNNW